MCLVGSEVVLLFEWVVVLWDVVVVDWFGVGIGWGYVECMLQCLVVLDVSLLLYVEDLFSLVGFVWVCGEGVEVEQVLLVYLCDNVVMLKKVF